MKEHQVRIVRYDNIVVIVKILKTIYRLKEIVLESVHFLIIEYIDGKMGRAHSFLVTLIMLYYRPTITNSLRIMSCIDTVEYFFLIMDNIL